MKILIYHSNIPISEALATHVDLKIGASLRRFHGRVRAAVVRIVDENGPRGGDDTRCSIVVNLDDGTDIVVKAVAADAYEAVTRASTRLHAQITRTIDRGKHDTRTRLRQPFLLR